MFDHKFSKLVNHIIFKKNLFNIFFIQSLTINSLVTQIQATSKSFIKYSFVNNGILTDLIYEFKIESLSSYGIIRMAKNLNVTKNYFREVNFQDYIFKMFGFHKNYVCFFKITLAASTISAGKIITIYQYFCINIVSLTYQPEFQLTPVNFILLYLHKNFINISNQFHRRVLSGHMKLEQYLIMTYALPKL